jgi:hypothetical protein
MDKKKKMIVAGVGVVMLGILVFILMGLFSDTKNNSVTSGFSSLDIKIPSVIESIIKEPSKINAYNRETELNPFKSEAGSFMPNSAAAQEKIDQAAAQEKLNQNNNLAEILKLQKIEEEKQKKFLEKLQEQYRNSESENKANNNSFNAERLRRGVNNNKKVVANTEKIISKEEQEEQLLSGAFGGASFGSQENRFYGAPMSSNTALEQTLTPAEIVDRTVITQGSTVPIRLMEDVFVASIGVTIPKNAVLYGMANLSGQRVSLSINAYKYKKTFYKINIIVYDFDGRAGIHLNEKTWPKIPGKIAKQVAEVAVQRATQQAPLGGGVEPLSLGEAKDLAVISGISEVSQELLLKRKVVLPRQYNVWLSVK